METLALVNPFPFRATTNATNSYVFESVTDDVARGESVSSINNQGPFHHLGQSREIEVPKFRPLRKKNYGVGACRCSIRVLTICNLRQFSTGFVGSF